MHCRRYTRHVTVCPVPPLIFSTTLSVRSTLVGEMFRPQYVLRILQFLTVTGDYGPRMLD